MNVINILEGMYLFCLGIIDMKECEVPSRVILTGGAISVLWRIARIVHGESGWGFLLFGMLPGVLLLFLAIVTKEIGPADGMVLVQVGILYGMYDAVFLLGLGLFGMTIVSVLLVLVGHVGRRTRIPCLPFFAGAYIILVLGGCWI